MDSANTISPTHLLETARIVPIADLSPNLSDPSTKAVGGVVTITWPYNKVKGTFAFNLAEPDFRLRRNRGQVRIEFRGRAAEAVGDSGIGGNDEILLSVGGAAWEAEEADRRRSLPGADLEWRLVFSESLKLRIKRAETSETDVVIVDEHLSHPPNDAVDERPNEQQIPLDLDAVQSIAVLKSPSPTAPLSPVRYTPIAQKVNASAFNDSEFASPAFVKRARMSYGALFEGGFDIFQEDDELQKRRPKHTRSGRYSSTWRYASRSPSPVSATTSLEIDNEQPSSPTRAARPAEKARMADEGCQTMEMDISSPQPRSIAPETQVDKMVSTGTLTEDVPADAFPNSARNQRTQTSPNDWFPESTDLSAPVPSYNYIPPTEPEAPLVQPDQQPDSGYTFASNPWIMGVAPPIFESQQHLPPPFSQETFASPGVGNILPSNQANPFIEVQEPIKDDIVYSTEQTPGGIDYPSAGHNEDVTSLPNHDEAFSNYPTAYLEHGHMPQHDQEIAEESGQYPEVAEAGSSSWATINHSSKATAAAPTDRLGSRDGSTPEHAVVIDESDDGSESEPEPMAVEDTVDSGRAYALDMYEDADAEDEVDAQYSDEDEPEYDADEMGGDYDTRNYEQPGDDDEGSLDEDLRPQPPEAEFDDGASWDEEEQQELVDEENEGEYEMDEDMPEPGPQPAVRANPMVIDLISSSEDESEDYNEDDGVHTSAINERSNTHIVSRVTPSHQQMNMEGKSRQVRFDDEESEIISQASISEADDSYDAGQDGPEYASTHEEVESENEREEHPDGGREDDRQIKEGSASVPRDELEMELREAEDIREHESFENQGKQPTDSELESEHEAGSEGNVKLGDVQNQIISHHQAVPEEAPEEGGSAPLSAADGLEILSRSVNQEWDSYSQRPAADLPVENMDNEQSPGESRDETDNELRGSLGRDEIPGEEPTQDHGETQTNLKPVDSNIVHLAPDTRKELNATAPSSPPSTQSFQTHIQATTIIEETTATSTLELAAAQFPTPSNTQATDISLNTSISTSTNIAKSFESITTVEQPNYTPREGSIEKSANNLVRQGSDENMDEDTVQQQLETAWSSKLQEQPPSLELSVTSSPARSFQSQVDNTELVLPDSIEEAEDYPQIPRSVSPESTSGASNASGSIRSIISHMDIDEELQASILEEESPLEDHPAHGDRGDSEDDELQASILEDVRLEDRLVQDGQDGLDDQDHQDDEDEQLQASILEEFPLEDHSDHGDWDSEDDELQASILEDSNWEDHLPHNDQKDEDESFQMDASKANIDLEEENQAESVPSLHEETPAKQLAEDISAQLRRNFLADSGSPEVESDTSIRNDPSVQLARIANSSKKRKRKRAASTDSYRPSKRLFDTHRNRTPETDDSSILFARASQASHTPRSEEDSYSMTAAKLQLARHLRDELPDCTSLKVLRQHLTKSLDVIAVAVMQPPDPQRAKGGPREFMMSFTVADHSIGPYAVAEALIYRPHKDTLPVIRYGDIVLLRNFTVVALPNKGFGLRSNESSSWAVFDYEGEPPQIRGPPVEYGAKEALYVSYLREWFGLLDIKAREKLELANRKIINAGKGRKST